MITPAPIETVLPVMLDAPKPKLLTYPRESVVAEKFEAMVKLGRANSRMKDLHDVRSLSRDFSFDARLLLEAIKKTFARRGTTLPVEKPLVFTAEFYDDEDKKKQWLAFVRKNRNYVSEMSLEQVCSEISAFVLPLLDTALAKHSMPRKWDAGVWIAP